LSSQTAASAHQAQQAIIQVESSVAEMGSLATGLSDQADALETVYRRLADTVRR
jgi:nitrate/nitrite-specific signal transduction histidine kinase